MSNQTSTRMFAAIRGVTAVSLAVAMTLSVSCVGPGPSGQLPASTFVTDPAGADGGSVYRCAAKGGTIRLDGDFRDWPAGAVWHKVGCKMSFEDEFEGFSHPANDRDGSLAFACIWDSKFLYVAMRVWDDVKKIDEDVGDEVWRDDSVEVYIDGDNNKSSEYESDTGQVTVGRYNVGRGAEDVMLNAYRGTTGMGVAATESGTNAAVVEGADGWAAEIRIPLASFAVKPAKGGKIGFNVHVNDDDDGGNYDHKLSWSKRELEGTNAAFRDPSIFGTLVFD